MSFQRLHEAGAFLGDVGRLATQEAGFLEHHAPTTYAWYKNFPKSFARLFGKLRVSELAKKHVRRWLEKSGYNPTSQNRGVDANESYRPRNGSRSSSPSRRSCSIAAPKKNAREGAPSRLTESVCRVILMGNSSSEATA
jgi:hypothetical protein